MILKILLFIYCVTSIILIFFISLDSKIWIIHILFGGFVSYLISKEDNKEITEEDIEELHAKIEKAKKKKKENEN